MLQRKSHMPQALPTPTHYDKLGHVAPSSSDNIELGHLHFNLQHNGAKLQQEGLFLPRCVAMLTLAAPLHAIWPKASVRGWADPSKRRLQLP